MNKAILIFAVVLCVMAYAQANVRVQPNPKCRLIKCADHSPKLLCVRSKRNNCRLLTACQLSRINCERGPLNALRQDHHRRCHGIKPGHKQKCRDIHRKW